MNTFKKLCERLSYSETHRNETLEMTSVITRFIANDEMFNDIDVDEFAKEYEEYSEFIKPLFQKDISDIFSRQHIIIFPANHCFQSIQFLLTVDDFKEEKLVINCFMRSCDLINKFRKDCMLVKNLGDAFISKLVQENGFKHDDTEQYNLDINMFIGSLHCYVKDFSKLSEVLRIKEV